MMDRQTGRATRAACAVLLLGAAGGVLPGAGQDRQAAGSGAGLRSMTLQAAAPRVDERTAVLFDGSSWDGWATREGGSSPWAVQPDGSVVVRGGDAVSRRELGDFQLHLEFMCPAAPGKAGQARSNSGVYIHGRYEIQVLESSGDAPSGDGCGGIYSIAAPLVNASAAAGAWQTYDIVFRAPRLGEGDAVVERPRVTVLHNGVVIHNNLELPATTPGGLDRRMVPRGPILLQDHGDPVRYRNIWVRDL